MPAQPVPTTILLIGASGYIGGSILHHLCSSNIVSSLRIFALVRSPADIQTISAAYPQVQTLLGDLSAEQVLEEAAAVADVIIYAAKNTQDGVESLMRGLTCEARHSGPGLFIMLSAIISLVDPKNMRLGEAPSECSRVMSDATDADAIMSLPMHHWHVAQERAFFRLAAKLGHDSVTPVVMGLPFAVGDGAGPVRKKGFVHEYATAMKRRDARKPFTMGQGQNVWSWACPQDIAAAIGTIVDEWRRDENRVHLGGYYYVEAGQLEMQKLARFVGQTLTQEAQCGCESLQYPQFAEIMPTLPGLWGVSARCQADRLRNIGWKPKNSEWKPLVEGCVRLAIQT